MYQFVIKNIFNEVLYKSISRSESASQALKLGFKMLNDSRRIDPKADLSAIENYVDVKLIN